MNKSTKKPMKPNGKPSKQVYFFTWGEKGNKKAWTKASRNRWKIEWKTLPTNLLFHLGANK